MKAKRIDNQDYGWVINTSFQKKVYELAQHSELIAGFLLNSMTIDSGIAENDVCCAYGWFTLRGS